MIKKSMETLNTKGPTIGVRLDAIDNYIIQELMNKLTMRPAEVIRLAISHYAKSMGIETDRIAIVEILRNRKF